MEDAKKPTGANSKEMIAQWCKGVQDALVLYESQFAHVRQIVANDEETWLLFDRLMQREYKQFDRKPARQGKASKRTSTTAPRKEGYGPMGSPNELFPFLGLPSNLLVPLFQNVLEGRIAFRAAQRQGIEYKSWISLGKEFEKRFNALEGQANKSRAIKKGKWVFLNDIRRKVVDVSRQCQPWLGVFEHKRQKLTPREIFVETTRQAYINAGKPKRKTADLPRQFQLMVTEEQKRATKGGGDTKWNVVESQTGGTNGVLLINDSNENLGKYLNPKEAKFGTLSLS
jgi:hypothetical protein